MSAAAIPAQEAAAPAPQAAAPAPQAAAPAPQATTPARDGAARPRIGRGFRLQWEQAQQAWVLLYPEGMVKLNGSAGEILRRCDGASSIAAIVAQLESAFGVADLSADVQAFVELARARRWLEG